MKYQNCPEHNAAQIPIPKRNRTEAGCHKKDAPAGVCGLCWQCGLCGTQKRRPNGAQGLSLGKGQNGSFTG
jgi:hypothetical protein